MEAGSSPARITSRRTGTPLSLSSVTPAATSARTSAATALPSRIWATSALEHREEPGGYLLLAAHDTREVYNAPSSPRVEGPLDQGAVAGAQELGPPRDDVRDHERREEVVVPGAQVFQGLEQLVPAVQDASPDGLDLGDAHLVPRARPVLLGVAVHDLLRREIRDVR